MQGNKLPAEIMWSETLNNHDIWCCCGASGLKNSGCLLAGNATIHDYKDRVAPNKGRSGFCLQIDHQDMPFHLLLVGFLKIFWKIFLIFCNILGLFVFCNRCSQFDDFWLGYFWQLYHYKQLRRFKVCLTLKKNPLWAEKLFASLLPNPFSTCWY